MKTDTILLAALTGLAMVSVVLTDLVGHSVPGILTTVLTTLVGATAGVAYAGTGKASAAAPPGVPNATAGQ